MIERTIDPELAQELSEISDGIGVGDWIRVTDQEGDQGRWERHHLLVLRYVGADADPDPDANLYGIHYSLGLTECQENDFPWCAEPGSNRLSERPVPLSPLEERVITTVYFGPRKKAS